MFTICDSIFPISERCRYCAYKVGGLKCCRKDSDVWVGVLGAIRYRGRSKASGVRYGSMVRGV